MNCSHHCVRRHNVLTLLLTAISATVVSSSMDSDYKNMDESCIDREGEGPSCAASSSSSPSDADLESLGGLGLGLAAATASTKKKSEESALLQRKANLDLSRTMDGYMTMWSDSATTIVGGSCEYANAASGGLSAPSAGSPYVASRAYCAADSTLYAGGATCGSCFRVAYDGSPATDPGTPGELVVQIVDSGSAKTFDCQVDAFETITGARTGVFPVTYEAVDCDVSSGGMVATVLDGNNAWYTKVVFSNLIQGVVAAVLKVDGVSYTMSRVSGATWSASPGGATGAATFAVTLQGGATVELSSCFDKWPVDTYSSCSAGSTAATTTEATTTTKTTTKASTTTATTASTTSTTTTAATTANSITTTSSSSSSSSSAASSSSCAADSELQNGTSIFLKAHTGMRLTVDGTEVHAKWDHQGTWQRFLIDKDSSGSLKSGEKIYLVAHTGNRVVVEGSTVHARWSNRGTWEALTVEKDGGSAGDVICAGDSIYLVAHTTKTLCVQDTEVHALWQNRLSWERFVIEKADAALLETDDKVQIVKH